MQQQEPEHENMDVTALVSEGMIHHYVAKPKVPEFPISDDEIQDLELAIEQSLAPALLNPQREHNLKASQVYLRPNVSGINPTEYLDKIYEGIGPR